MRSVCPSISQFNNTSFGTRPSAVYHGRRLEEHARLFLL